MTANQMIKTLAKAGFDMTLVTKQGPREIEIIVRDEEGGIDFCGSWEAAHKAMEAFGYARGVQSGYGSVSIRSEYVRRAEYDVCERDYVFAE